MVVKTEPKTKKSWKAELKECLGIILVFGVGILSIQWFGNSVSTVKVHGTSMNPTLSDQDCLLISTDIKQVSRGDIVLVESLEITKSLIKRVIALPGDVVELKPIEQESGQYLEQVWLNGELLEEPYTDGIINWWTVQERRFEVPEGHVFILGDYRIDSMDSRYLKNPYIEMERVKGSLLMRLPNQVCRN